MADESKSGGLFERMAQERRESVLAQIDLNRCPKCAGTVAVVRYVVDVLQMDPPPRQVERYELRVRWQCLLASEDSGEVRVGPTDLANPDEAWRATRSGLSENGESSQ